MTSPHQSFLEGKQINNHFHLDSYLKGNKYLYVPQISCESEVSEGIGLGIK